jgi:hypothetical protein
MKFFNKVKWTVGGTLRGGDLPPLSPHDKVLADIYAAKRMNKDGISKIFSPLSKKEVEMLDSQKLQTTRINTQLPHHE